MILQALAEYYETQARLGQITAPGWGKAKVSYAIDLNGEGKPEGLQYLEQERQQGKKKAFVPQEINVPAPVKRTSSPMSNFLCDNSSYILGVDEKGNPQRAQRCFELCKELHEKLLCGLNTPAAEDLLRFFENWSPEKVKDYPVIQDNIEKLCSGANIVFRHNGVYVHEDAEIRSAWERHYAAGNEAGDKMICLVSGESCEPEKIHPSIKNVAGAQSSGAALVSFNAPAFCSYGKEQNANAPVSKHSAFAYTTALNHLLSGEHVYRMGDSTTIVCWAKNCEDAYAGIFAASYFGNEEPKYSAADMRAMLKSLAAGNPVLYNELMLDPNMDFYVLALSPNAARLSVRFFLRNSFGKLIKNVQEHYERLEISRPAYDPFEFLPMWRLISETVNPNSRDKSGDPKLAGELFTAVLSNTRYPATLLNAVTLRIRAEREVSRGRAAIIKACYLKNPHKDVPKEVLTVSLNPESTNVPYNLGRLFSLLEAIQTAANPGINSTVKDKYFNSASSTPATVFPTLINLAQKHMRKLDTGMAVYYDKQLTELMSALQEDFPRRMSLPQQGAFQLGYYHQTQARYQKKEEK